MSGEFPTLLLGIIFLTACASATSDKPAAANRAQNISDTLQYEANFKDQLLSVLYAYDKTKGTNFRQTPITEIEGAYHHKDSSKLGSHAKSLKIRHPSGPLKRT